ncbi:MAG: hypothetical protein IT456_17255 [Planctomycetes bacterium]|jgi:hypothetical protein|nr:hypothetical protein [Planctomycetota bacterium]
MIQGGNEGLRGSSVVVQGGSVNVDVGPNDTSVEISQVGGGPVTTIPVTPGKETSVPIPNVPGGAVLYVRVGRGNRARIMVVEVVSSFH